MNERSSSIHGLLCLLLWILTLFRILWSQDSATSFVLHWTDRDLSGIVTGFQYWKDAFGVATTSSVANTTNWASVRTHGMAAVGCASVSDAPVCQCLSDAHTMAAQVCVRKADLAMRGCFMNARPVQWVDELSYGTRPFLILFQINTFGALAACVTLAKSKDKPMLPYNLQIGVGLLALVIFSVLQPGFREWIPFLYFLFMQVFVSWATRRDDYWRTSQFLLIYFLVLPLIVVLFAVYMQRRDIMYIIVQYLLAYALVLAAACRTLVSLVQSELDSGMRVVSYTIVLIILTMLCMSYNQFPTQFPNEGFFRSSLTVWLVFILYMVMALFKPDKPGVALYSDLALRTLLTASMLNDL